MNYETVLHELQEYRRAEKRKKLGSNTWLWAEDSSGAVWNTKDRGALDQPTHIHVRYYDSNIITWARGRCFTEFPSERTSRRTIDQIYQHSNFYVWRRGDNAFVQLKGSKHVLPFPYARHLDNQTGEMVEHCDASWLNNFDSYKFFEGASKLATQLTHALVYGKISRGWTDEVCGRSWSEDFGMMASPDIVNVALGQMDSKIPTIELLLGALEKTRDPSYWRELIQACRPPQYKRLWKGRSVLDKCARELVGGAPHFRDQQIRHPSEFYKELKNIVLDGLLYAARIEQ